MNCISAKEVTNKSEVSKRQIMQLGTEERIPLTEHTDNMWLIPCNAEKPTDTKYYEANKTILSAKPFLKWAGGKSQLVNIIRKYYPFSDSVTKYAEPFIGGGAIFFDILNNYTLKEIYLSDINADLINCYLCIRDNLEILIKQLKHYQNEFLSLDAEKRKLYYTQKRALYNNKAECSGTERAVLLLFLNKTCFNGLYRVNKKGEYNVPMGSYKNPLICNETNLRLVSQKLQSVEIVCADYKQSIDFIDNNTFVYFDPPYRPLSQTASFTSYTENEFNDSEQIALFEFIQQVDNKGAKFLLSNSDPKNINENDNFFDKLYSQYKIVRIEASRMINCKSELRGKIKELLISNY